MRKVHTAESLVEAAHLRNVLEAAGISCFVRNEGLAGAIGEIPFVECWPELWVVRNGEALRARGLIDEARRAEPVAGPAWRCERCGELVEAQFDACWRCSGERQQIGADDRSTGS
ncbi:MAG TPA: DUF2007 domain-containing protein [Steroidobacteraceae bacterium]|nr:DUF2007 domain-containing protein [Steroidobacteraceae bacterium]